MPGAAAGLEHAHRRFGSLPWRDLVAPAIDLARDGVEVTPMQAYLHEILVAIIGPAPGAGERLRFVDLAVTLERVADEGTAFLSTGDVARALCEIAPQITLEDLAGYRVITRRPVATTFRSHDFASNPPPSSGGVLIAYGLQLLERGGAFEPADLIETMRGQNAVRDRLFHSQLYRGGLARRLVDAPSMTTHISVVDADGNAASLSCSTGSGSGVVIPGTGLSLNNMLGERDLAGLHRPGSRLTSMMAPSICFAGGSPRLVLGSAGSARLRGAILQVIVNSLARGMNVQDAVDAPRVHLEDEVVHAEQGIDARGLGYGQADAVEGAQPLLRRRQRRRGAAGRDARRRRGRPSRRRRGRGRVIVVRRAEPADAAALVALASAVSAEPEGWMIWSEWRGVGDERRYLRAVRGHPDAAVFVAELDGELAGRLSLARDQNPASHHVADLGLMVDERFRRRGIGRALLEAAVAWAPEHGVAKLELHVFPWNEGAIALYEAFGFEREGLRRRHYLRPDGYADAILMALQV